MLQHISHADGQVPSRNAFFHRFEGAPVPGLSEPLRTVCCLHIHCRQEMHCVKLFVDVGAQSVDLALVGL